MAEPTSVSIELFGASAACHDFHTVDGDFSVQLTALRSANTSQQPCIVTTPMTRANYRVLAEIPALLQQHRVSQWLVALPETQNTATLIARLTMAIPFGLHAVDRAIKLGLDVVIRGAPLCLLGPYRERASPGPGRSYPPTCQGCRLRPECPGVAASYVDAFGSLELTAVV